MDWFELERTFKGHLVHPRAMSRDIFNWIGLLRALSNLALNVPRKGASSTSPGILCQGFTTRSIKNLCLYIQPEPPLFQFTAITPCPVTSGPCHSPSPALSQPLQALPGCSKVSPQLSLPQADQPQLSQPFLPAEGFQPSDHCWGLLWPCSNSSSSVLC